jgi:hypothetical protein
VWYGVAGLLLAGGMLGGMVVGTQAVLGLVRVDDLQRFTTGETVDVELDPDEPASIYVRQDDTGTLPRVDCSATPPPGQTIDLDATDLTTTVLSGGGVWVAEYDVDVSGAATYAVACRDFRGFAQLQLGIGRRADPMATVNRFRGAGLVCTAATAAGIVLGLVVLLERSADKRRRLTYSPPPWRSGSTAR